MAKFLSHHFLHNVTYLYLSYQFGDWQEDIFEYIYMLICIVSVYDTVYLREYFTLCWAFGF